MVAHPLWAVAAGALRLTLDRLEHVGQRPRVVAGARHDLRAEQIRLLLEIAAVAEQHRAEAELAALRDRVARAAADHRAADRAGDLAELQPRILCLRHV